MCIQFHGKTRFTFTNRMQFSTESEASFTTNPNYTASANRISRAWWVETLCDETVDWLTCRERSRRFCVAAGGRPRRCPVHTHTAPDCSPATTDSQSHRRSSPHTVPLMMITSPVTRSPTSCCCCCCYRCRLDHPSRDRSSLRHRVTSSVNRDVISTRAL